MSKGNRIRNQHREEGIASAQNKQNKARSSKQSAEMAAKRKKTFRIIALCIIVIIIAAIIGGIMYKRANSDTYKYLNYSKYVTVGEYKGLTYEKADLSVSKEEVQSEIEARLAAAAETKTVTKGKVKDGDTVKIDYVGKIDGKEFTGGSANDYDLTIGSGSFIDGFEDGLIGKKVGETVTLDLTFPKDYGNEDVAGKDVAFTVTIKSKQKTITPKYDEEFIKANSDFDNKADYEASVKKDLKKQKKEQAESSAKAEIWQKVLDDSKVKSYPKKQLKKEQKAVEKSYKNMAEQYGMEWDAFQSAMGLDSKAIKKQAKESVKSKLCEYSIAKTEGIKLTNKQYKARLDKMLKDAGMTKDQFKSQYGMTIYEYAEQNDFYDGILMEKVEDFIYKNAKEVEKKAEDESKDDSKDAAADESKDESKDEAADESKDEKKDE